MRRSKTLAVIISIALMSPVFGAGRWYAGDPDGGCNQLLPNADTANTNWTAANAGNLYDELDVNVNSDSCYTADNDSGATSYIACAAGTTCNVEFALTDTANVPADAVIDFVYVSMSCLMVGGSLMTAPRMDLKLEVNSTEYTADTNISCNDTTSYLEIATKIWETSPDTSTTWTTSELDGASLHIDQTNASSSGAARINNVVVSVFWGDPNTEGETSETRYSLSGGN